MCMYVCVCVCCRECPTIAHKADASDVQATPNSKYLRVRKAKTIRTTLC